MNNKDFDKFIQDQLGKLEADFDSQHWEMMEHRLNTEPAPEGGVRGNDSLDEVIGSKLGGLEVAFDANHWDLMDQKLDAELLTPEVEDIYLDGVAYDNLADLHPPYNPAHWALMSKRLDEAFSLRHRIYKYKIAEVAVMLLTILTLLPYLPLSKHFATKDQTFATQQNILPDAASDNAFKDASANQQGATNIASLAPENKAKQSANGATSVVVDPSSTSLGPINQEQLAPNRIFNLNPLAISPISKNGRATDATSQEVLSPLAKLPGQPSTALGAPLNETTAAQQSLVLNPIAASDKKESSEPKGLLGFLSSKLNLIRFGKSGTFDMSKLVAPSSMAFAVPYSDQFFTGPQGGLPFGLRNEKWELNIPSLYTAAHVSRKVNMDTKEDEFVFAGTAPIQQSLLTDPIAPRNAKLKEKARKMPAGFLHVLKSKTNRLRLGMFGAFDLNYVMTPFNPTLSVPSYDQFFTGYGGGLSLGVGGEKWELDIAAIYASTYYSPEKIRINVETGDFENGWLGKGLTAVHLELLKLPVNVHRSLGKMGKVQVSALAGVAANIALYTNYEVKLYPIGVDPDSSLAAPAPTPSTGGEGSALERNFDGLFQGRNIKNNVYLTANLGFRLERDLTARWSIFMQPSYQHRIFANGFGPNKDRINSVSLYIGTRVNLK